MILADTSVWVEHLRKGRADLAAALEAGEVVCHPFVIGELACGRLEAREEILQLLAALPRTEAAEDAEVMHLLESRRLYGQGLGWVDVHLLAASLVSGVRLWTMDRALRRAAESLAIARS